MGKAKIIAGSWPASDARVELGGIVAPVPGKFLWQTEPWCNFVSVEQLTEDRVKKMSGTVGWGTAGAVLLGPVGLLAGLLAGGRKTEIGVFLLHRDGRQMLITMSPADYMQARSSVRG